MDDRDFDTTQVREPVSRVFRLEKHFLTGGIINLIFFSLVFFGCGYGMWMSAPVDRRVYSIPLAAGCWLFTAPLFIWSILVWNYVSVTLQNGNIALKGVFFSREIKLSDIEFIH